jgi:hypothetical protein
VEKEKLQREVQDGLEEARHRLMGANEVHDFLAENNVGGSSARVDVGPAGVRNNDTDEKATSGSGKSGWGFGGLFHAGEATPPVIPSFGVPTTVSRSAAGEPLLRKLGGLFGGRGDCCSSITPAAPCGLPLVQEAMYNGPDRSSTAGSAELWSPSDGYVSCADHEITDRKPLPSPQTSVALERPLTRSIGWKWNAPYSSTCWTLRCAEHLTLRIGGANFQTAPFHPC